jgi:hypothetical protein
MLIEIYLFNFDQMAFGNLNIMEDSFSSLKFTFENKVVEFTLFT